MKWQGFPTPPTKNKSKQHFKVNGSLLNNPRKLLEAKAQIDTIMQQLDPTWNLHQKLEFLMICVRTTLTQMGQIKSSQIF